MTTNNPLIIFDYPSTVNSTLLVILNEVSINFITEEDTLIKYINFKISGDIKEIDYRVDTSFYALACSNFEEI